MEVKGVKGKAMKAFKEKVSDQDYEQLFKEFSMIDQSYDGIPKDIRQKYFQTVSQIIEEKKKDIILKLKY